MNAIARRGTNALAALLATGLGSGCGDPMFPQADRLGTLVVTNYTTGSAFDLDGFVLTIDGAVVAPLELNSTLEFPIEAGVDHEIRLEGLQGNCSSLDESTHTARVETRKRRRINFRVECTAPDFLKTVRLLHVVQRDRSASLIAMNGDGSDATEVTAGWHLRGPHISPDGTRVVYTRWEPLEEDQPELFVARFDGTRDRRLLSGPAYGGRWSPDGEEILYWAPEKNNVTTLHVVNASGMGGAQVTGRDGPAEDSGARWSPDGGRIAFVRTLADFDGSDTRVWVVNRDGSNARPLTHYYSASPVWSAVEQRIVYRGVTSPSGRPGVLVSHADSSRVAMLVDGALGEALQPHDWSADGSMLLMTRKHGHRTELYLYRVDDQALFRLTAGPDHHIDPVFR